MARKWEYCNKHLNVTENLSNALVFYKETTDLFQRMGFTSNDKGPSADAVVRQLLHGAALTTYSGIISNLRQDEFDRLKNVARNAGGIQYSTVVRPLSCVLGCHRRRHQRD